MIQISDRSDNIKVQHKVFTQVFILFPFCSNAVIHVEIQNEGEDAFKPEVYGDVIIVERRISESTSSTTLKDRHGVFLVFVFICSTDCLLLYVFIG